MACLQGEALHCAFREYYDFSKNTKKKRQATLEEIRWFSDRFLKFLGSKQFSLETVTEYYTALTSVGIGGKVWKESSAKNELKLAIKISNWLACKSGGNRLEKGFKISDFDLPLQDDDEAVNLAELPSIEIAQQIVILGTTPGIGDNRINRERKGEMRDALDFILRTGIRVGELRKMCGQDILLDAEVPCYKIRGSVSKSRTSAILPLSQDDSILQMLRKRQAKERLFEVSDSTMNKNLKRGCQLYGWTGKSITNHSLRHIFASNCAKNGMPLIELQKLMRHSSPDITMKYYVHLNVKDLSSSVNSHHDLMKNTLSVHQDFMLIKQAVENTGIVFKEKYDYVPEMTRDGLILRVQLRSSSELAKS